MNASVCWHRKKETLVATGTRVSARQPVIDAGCIQAETVGHHR
jgi:hypothetical protein